jgi:Domain of unknown function (DUF4139)
MRPTTLGLFLPIFAVLTGCSTTTTYIHGPDTTLGRVVVYRNGVAYFERTADVVGDQLTLKVPVERIDDFLKSLTVVDAKTGAPAPIRYPTERPTSESGLVDMNIGLDTPGPHKLKLSYVTEAPSWKPSYRVVLEQPGKVELEAWAIVDNTSGEDWKNVRLGVGSSSALSFRFDLQSVRLVERETLRQNDLLALAPPTGGSPYGAREQKPIAELDDRSLDTPPPPPAPPAAVAMAETSQASPAPSKSHAKRIAVDSLVGGASGYGSGGGAPSAQAPDAGFAKAADDGVSRMAESLKKSRAHVVIEGFGKDGDADKAAESLARAEKLRERLVASGVSADQLVAVGRGLQAGKNGGVRVVAAPPPASANAKSETPGAGKADSATAGEPIGTSHFESGNVTSVARGMSAMVSILKQETQGEVVYLYDPEGERGNARFPFKSVRLTNPSDSSLETGPVSVFGDGHFIGEGMAEAIPARGEAFVPFALDRQIVVDKVGAETDEIARILTVQRGVVSTEVQHKRKTTFTLTNRQNEAATVYVRHTVPEGYKLGRTTPGLGDERLGSAHLFRQIVGPQQKVEVTIEEATPVLRTIDVRSPEGLDQIRVYLSTAAATGKLKEQFSALVQGAKDIADIEQRIATEREQMEEYRARMNELHEQIFTLKAVRTGGRLMQSLEGKMADMSDKLSKATIDVVALEEKRMVARIHFQDQVAELTLEGDGARAG